MFRLVSNSGMYVRFLRDEHGGSDYTKPIVDHRPSRATKFFTRGQAETAALVMAQHSLPFLGYHGPVRIEEFTPLAVRIIRGVLSVLPVRK